MIQRLGITFNGRLTRRIKCHVRHRHDAKNRADIDYPAFLLLPNMWQHSAGHTHYTHKIGVKQSLCL